MIVALPHPTPGRFVSFQSFRTTILIITLFFVFRPCSAGGATANPNILIIHSYHPSFEWTRSLHDGLISTLDEWNGSANLSVEYMDTKRIPTEEHTAGLVTLYKAKYGTSPPDIVISSDNNAFSMLNIHREEIFGTDVPVVFCGVNYFDIKDWEPMPRILGVDERPDFSATVEMIDTIHPDGPPVALLVDQTTTGRVHKENISELIDDRRDGERFRFVDEGSPDDIIDAIHRLPEDAVIIYYTFARDTDGNTYPPESLANQIADEQSRPIYGNYTWLLGKGIIGGPIITGREQGQRAMNLALGVITGAIDPDDFRLEATPSVMVIDYNRAKAAKIPILRIPAGAEVINRPQAFWRAFPLETALAVTILALLISGLLATGRLLRQRAALLAEIREINADLERRVKHRSEELNRAERELMRNERMASLGSLVAGVTHEVNTPLGMAVTGTSYLRERFDDINHRFLSEELSSEEFRDFITTGSELCGTLQTSLKRASDQIRNFKQVAVDQTGEFPRRIRMSELLSDFLLSMKNSLKRTDIRVETACPEDLSIIHFPGDIWRILANFLMNSLKHGYPEDKTGTIMIVVTQAGPDIRLVYTDDGVGISDMNAGRIFEPYFTTARDTGGSGLGLHLIRSIVEDRHGGTVAYEPAVPHGVRFTVVFPSRSPAMPDKR